MSSSMRQSAAQAAPGDLELLERMGRGDAAAFESLMRQQNGRLFRVARGILRNDAEAEDALQDAYIDAFRHLSSFRRESSLATWLTRIVINHALMRLRKSRRDRTVVSIGGEAEGEREGGEGDVRDDQAEPPPVATFRQEIRHLLERRLDELPVSFRTVFIMRDVNEMNVEETAEALGIPSATVRTRLFRARALLREALAKDIDSVTLDVFGFAGARCDRIVARVMSEIFPHS
jgi:RNA polymerase sigma-70 factor (ECF subfamily)